MHLLGKYQFKANTKDNETKFIDLLLVPILLTLNTCFSSRLGGSKSDIVQ